MHHRRDIANAEKIGEELKRAGAESERIVAASRIESARISAEAAKQAEAARDESGGLIDMVSDDEILAAYKLLASKEGVFVEPASAASVAGILKLGSKGFFSRRPKAESGKLKAEIAR